MSSLVIKYLWSLSLLLLPPLELQGDYWDYSDYEMDPELRRYVQEIYSTGPTKPPTKERIIERIIVEPDRPLDDEDDEYCNTEIRFKNIYYRLLCYPEHYFVSVAYNELRRACYGERVECKNGAAFCRRSMDLMDGVQCTLVSGKSITDCSYKSVFMTGYAVVTCQWDSDTQEFIPNKVHNMLLPE